jgi:hypothetical protein
MKATIAWLALTVLALGSAGRGESAEDPQEPVTVVLRDGGTLRGTIVREDGDVLTFRTASGVELQVPRRAIASISRAEPTGWPADPNDTRLLFASTGRPLKKGDGYFSDHYVVFPGFAYGLTDHFSLAGGMSVVPAVGLERQVFYVSPRLGWQVSRNTALSVGGLYASASDDAAGLLFGAATVGPPDRSLTAGIGFVATREYEDRRGPRGEYLGTSRRWTLHGEPIVMVGGSLRVSRHVALLSENWLFLGNDFDLSYQPFGVGLRFFGDRVSADVGVILIGEVLEEGFPLPWLSVSYHFGPSRGAARRGGAPRLPGRVRR